MIGNIYTNQKCPVCQGSMPYDPRRGNCICKEHNIGATGGYFVRFGREHFKRFPQVVQAEQHLNHLRAQKGGNPAYGEYDPRDWKRSNPLGLDCLGEQWIKKKAATRPPLSDTRMHELKMSIMRAVKFWGDVNIKALTDAHLSDFATSEHTCLNSSNPLSEKSVFNICTNLQEFILWGCKVARTEPPHFEGLGYESEETQPITIEQQQAIINWIFHNCPEPRIWFAILCLCRNANVRPGELMDVRWEHIDLFGELIYVHKDKNRRKINRRKKAPKVIFLKSDQVEYLRSQSYDNLNDFFFVYTVERSGCTIGSRIHPKRLNYWFKEGGRKAIGIETTLYAGTKHTTTTSLNQYINRQLIRRGGTMHSTEAAYEHYQHDTISDQIRVQEAYDRMIEDAREGRKVGLKKVK